MSDITYRQCHLRRPETGQFDTAWIPAHLAKAGKHVVFKDMLGTWLVDEVYGSTTLSTEELLRRRENLKRFQWVLGD